ncbi:hypothetical protein D3C73_876610 [compost metagenome]
MRVGGQALFRLADADLVEQFQYAAAGGATHHRLVHFQNLADLPLDRVQRIERGHRLLEDHRDVVAAHMAQFRFRCLQEILALKQYFARGVACGRIGQKLQDGIGRDRFAGAGFADQS